MKHLNVAVIDSELAAKLGKKGTASDLTIYHAKEGETVMSYIEPTLYPQKIQPLLFSLRMADVAVLCVNQLDKFLGECVVALDLLGMNGIVAVGEMAGEEDVRRILKGTSLEKWPVVKKDVNDVRRALGEVAVERPDGPVLVPIDHSFAVKSVGSVALGIVARGVLKKHAKLQIYPTEKIVEAKSLQVQDEERESVETGSRVGVAVKGAEIEELGRGRVLAEPGSRKIGEKLNVKVREAVVAKGQTGGTGLFANVGLNMIPAKLEGSELELSDKVSYAQGEKLLLVKPDAKLRIVGVAEA